jgi:predicted ArsR family transcriptional regulator
VLKLCDGRRSAGEIARALGLPYGMVRGILDELRMRGYLQALLAGVVGG